jgi:O-antigen/teichoic acid export membrane protein
VKHYLAEETGFAYAATLGRMVAFLPAAVAMAMFPKVSSAGGTTSEHKSVFLHAFVYTALFAAAAAAGCALMPGFFLRILFGITDAPARLEGMVRIMALVMTFSALLNVTMQFLLAQRKFKASGVIILAAAGYLLSVFYFHQSVGQIIGAAGLFNMLALAGGFWFILRLKATCPER